MNNQDRVRDSETEIVETEILQQKAHQNIWLELMEAVIPGMLPRIDLVFTKPFIIMGRVSSAAQKPDILFPGNLKKIGRQHVRIECRDSGYYVVDLGSANHTLLNDEVLIPNQPYLLEDGMELAFTTHKIIRYRIHLQ